MGVDYKPVLGIGKEFGESYEVVDFLAKHRLIYDKDTEAIEADGIEEFMNNHRSGLSVEGLNAYTGYGYFVGFPFYVQDVSGIQEKLDKTLESWYKVFPDEDCEVVHTVMVY